MREIKFRAWIKNHWLYDGKKRTEPMIYDWQNTIYPEYDGFAPEDIPIMQYTGLKDKNGIEIYEKDIIILEPDDSKEFGNEPTSLSYGDVCVVEWSNTNLAYYLMPINEDIEEQQMDYYGAWHGWNWIKIIGNSYENPELLKGA